MVISDKHEYLFIELPRTGSTAIRKELIENYGGKDFLHKHATYSEFLRNASEKQKKYFIISGKRNPLDRTVSEYLKYKYNHNSVLDRFEERVENSGFNILKYLRAKYFLRRVIFAQKNTTTFKDYYLRFFNNPYCDFGFIDHRHCDFIIRFEHISKDFSTLLNKMNLKKIRDLPKTNKTENKKKDFWDYYREDFITEVKRNNKVYFRIAGYSFPENWQATEPNKYDWFKFYLFNLPKIIYWNFFSNK